MQVAGLANTGCAGSIAQSGVAGLVQVWRTHGGVSRGPDPSCTHPQVPSPISHPPPPQATVMFDVGGETPQLLHALQDARHLMLKRTQCRQRTSGVDVMIWLLHGDLDWPDVLTAYSGPNIDGGVCACRELSLAGCRQLEDHDLGAVGDLTALTALDFSYCTKFTDAGAPPAVTVAPSQDSLTAAVWGQRVGHTGPLSDGLNRGTGWPVKRRWKCQGPVLTNAVAAHSALRVRVPSVRDDMRITLPSKGPGGRGMPPWFLDRTD